MALSSKTHWDKGYRRQIFPKPTMITPGRSYADSEILDFIAPYLPVSSPDRPVQLLEMGCGGSQWLPYFTSRRHYEVSGIDYSEAGCQLAREYLQANQCPGNIYCRDFFELGDEFEGQYDVVFSLGVVEHFTQTGAVIEQFARCLVPGGLLLTLIPHMKGGIGLLQYKVDEAVYNMHVPLNLDDLVQAHTTNGLHIVAASYLGFGMLQMINVNNLPVHPLIRNFIIYLLPGIDLLHLSVRRLTGFKLQSSFWSSYAMVIAQYQPN